MDVFTAPNLARVVEHLAADAFVVYGVVTEICVLFAARGLLKYGKPVTIVTDAIAALTAEASERALRRSAPPAARWLSRRKSPGHEVHPRHAARAARSSAPRRGPDTHAGTAAKC